MTGGSRSRIEGVLHFQLRAKVMLLQTNADVYEFATISDWYTGGWHRTKLAFQSVGSLL